MRESSSPKRNSDSALASSVLPTPVGPAKMNEPDGRFGSLSPARVRRIAREIDLTESSWPMTRLCSSSSIRSRQIGRASCREGGKTEEGRVGQEENDGCATTERRGSKSNKQ